MRDGGIGGFACASSLALMHGRLEIAGPARPLRILFSITAGLTPAIPVLVPYILAKMVHILSFFMIE